MILERKFYQRNAIDVARDLLGKVLVNITEEGIVKGKIVEVEAYLGAVDKAAHSYNNLRTKRTEVQYGEAGHAYVYLIYGLHCCMNIVVSKINNPEMVLIRALEPVHGIELMRKRRQVDDPKILCNGPGKLCKAMGITKEYYGSDLCSAEFFVETNQEDNRIQIQESKRININYAQEDKDRLWRFLIKGNKYISKGGIKK